MSSRRIAPLALILFAAAACATAPERAPVDTVRAGTYVLVEPTPDQHTAVTINEGAYAARVGNRTWTGQHWLDAQGRYHMVDDSGPCAGQEAVWEYTTSGNRVTMNLVSDACSIDRFSSSRLVYERR